MKKIRFSLICLLLAALATSCSGAAEQAEKAFEDGTLKQGATYEEVIQVLGQPYAEEKSDEGVWLMYSTAIISHYYILLLPQDDGTFAVSASTSDDTQGNLWGAKISKRLI